MLVDTIRKSGVGSGTVFNQTTDGILLFYDTGRTKWLSTIRETFTFGIDHINITTERFMQVSGTVITSKTGIRIPRNATITSISVQTSNIATGDFKVRKNNGSSNLIILSLVGNQGKSQDNVSIDLNQNDWIQVLASPGAGQIDNPILILELAWRT